MGKAIASILDKNTNISIVSLKIKIRLLFMDKPLKILIVINVAINMKTQEENIS
ncbi:hypothetical protein JP0130_09640 [Helicobacter pylori]|nr:hypothetical protein JP0130_09640 [Helicobacter pylori]